MNPILIPVRFLFLQKVTLTNLGTQKQVTYKIVSEKEADLKGWKNFCQLAHSAKVY
jgi:hypothetical protein